MVYFTSVNTFLHESSLLVTAYPETTRITTKYSLPRKTSPPNRVAPAHKISKDKPKSDPSKKESKFKRPASDTEAGTTKKEAKIKPATLIFKTFEPGSGICLKYRTDKQAEVGRLMLGLGKLAKGEVIEEVTAGNAAALEDKMEVDVEVGAEGVKKEESVVVDAKAGGTGQTGGGGGGGGKKKKKGKK